MKFLIAGIAIHLFSGFCFSVSANAEASSTQPDADKVWQQVKADVAKIQAICDREMKADNAMKRDYPESDFDSRWGMSYDPRDCGRQVGLATNAYTFSCPYVTEVGFATAIKLVEDAIAQSKSASAKAAEVGLADLKQQGISARSSMDGNGTIAKMAASAGGSSVKNLEKRVATPLWYTQQRTKILVDRKTHIDHWQGANAGATRSISQICVRQNPPPGKIDFREILKAALKDARSPYPYGMVALEKAAREGILRYIEISKKAVESVTNYGSASQAHGRDQGAVK